MSHNDVVGLHAEYERWVKRTKGLIIPKGATLFDLFCAEQFLLSDQDIIAGLIGKSRDGGVDCFYFLLDGSLVEENTDISAQAEQSVHLVMMQTKEGSGFSANSIEKFATFTDDLLDLSKTPDTRVRTNG
jgi:hypothetical protein